MKDNHKTWQVFYKTGGEYKSTYVTLNTKDELCKITWMIWQYTTGQRGLPYYITKQTPGSLIKMKEELFFKPLQDYITSKFAFQDEIEIDKVVIVL